jgi:TetR/AcrR family transcriptional regulator, transcriptional repressor for nem operon
MDDFAQAKGSRKEALTALAVDMIQAQGYSALGLRDLADAAHIRAASLYSHFSSKDELARLAMSLYSARQGAELSVLEQATTGSERLRGYLGIFEQAIRHDGRLCLGLMLTVERNSLSEEVMNEVGLFVDQHTAWLAAAWDLGRSDLTVKSDLSGHAVGPVLLSALEGMMAFALVRPNPEAVFRTQATTLFAAFGVKA